MAWINQNYSVGKEVKVYYDPENPDLAVLVPGAKELVLNCWVGAATAAACCAVSLVILLRQKRKETIQDIYLANMPVQDGL